MEKLQVRNGLIGKHDEQIFSTYVKHPYNFVLSGYFDTKWLFPNHTKAFSYNSIRFFYWELMIINDDRSFLKSWIKTLDWQYLGESRKSTNFDWLWLITAKLKVIKLKPLLQISK